MPKVIPSGQIFRQKREELGLNQKDSAARASKISAEKINHTHIIQIERSELVDEVKLKSYIKFLELKNASRELYTPSHIQKLNHDDHEDNYICNEGRFNDVYELSMGSKKWAIFFGNVDDEHEDFCMQVSEFIDSRGDSLNNPEQNLTPKIIFQNRLLTRRLDEELEANHLTLFTAALFEEAWYGGDEDFRGHRLTTPWLLVAVTKINGDSRVRQSSSGLHYVLPHHYFGNNIFNFGSLTDTKKNQSDAPF